MARASRLTETAIKAIRLDPGRKQVRVIFPQSVDGVVKAVGRKFLLPSEDGG